MSYPTHIPKPVQIYRTQDFGMRLTVWKRRPGTDGESDAGLARDLTTLGSSWDCHIRPSILSGTALICTVDDSEAASGVLVVTATGDQTADLVSGATYGLDLRATDDGGGHVFLVYGEVIVSGAYTRD